MSAQCPQVHHAIHQHTFSDTWTYIGIGRYTGLHVIMRVLPAPANSGIRFIRRDVNSVNNEIIVTPYNIRNEHGCITVSNAVGIRVASADRLLAALSHYSIDNATIVLDSPEIPHDGSQSIDGSGISFAQIISDVGTKAQSALRDNRNIPQPNGRATVWR
ncbi:UDP-3-O-acyl-N-acetylglucosamine deacetylase [Marinagarivorans cellulosilyticus]|uniref:Uncharacterized protein n=1 Tax=Marinagarivorans cellulosilyticus TaxID=2721545 RepID=A0AAN1WGU0_9GAMM|nr:UDP-3-O-acyl-N-acetylglucosamine deacetylase [Marinagarivorans cellulosilyticus]BCD97343.1 hypothetical protein MARGE09_P1544 [Marinagarivorans cellulosilyticus]